MEFIVAKKIYKYFPVFFTRTALAIGENLISHNLESKHNRIRAFYRYSHFIKAKVVYLLTGENKKNGFV
jgi:hypothetical protein